MASAFRSAVLAVVICCLIDAVHAQANSYLAINSQKLLPSTVFDWALGTNVVNAPERVYDVFLYEPDGSVFIDMNTFSLAPSNDVSLTFTVGGQSCTYTPTGTPMDANFNPLPANDMEHAVDAGGLPVAKAWMYANGTGIAMDIWTSDWILSDRFCADTVSGTLSSIFGAPGARTNVSGTVAFGNGATNTFTVNFKWVNASLSRSSGVITINGVSIASGTYGGIIEAHYGDSLAAFSNLTVAFKECVNYNWGSARPDLSVQGVKLSFPSVWGTNICGYAASRMDKSLDFATATYSSSIQLQWNFIGFKPSSLGASSVVCSLSTANPTPQIPTLYSSIEYLNVTVMFGDGVFPCCAFPTRPVGQQMMSASFTFHFVDKPPNAALPRTLRINSAYATAANATAVLNSVPITPPVDTQAPGVVTIKIPFTTNDSLVSASYGVRLWLSTKAASAAVLSGVQATNCPYTLSVPGEAECFWMTGISNGAGLGFDADPFLGVVLNFTANKLDLGDGRRAVSSSEYHYNAPFAVLPFDMAFAGTHLHRPGFADDVILAVGISDIVQLGTYIMSHARLNLTGFIHAAVPQPPDAAAPTSDGVNVCDPVRFNASSVGEYRGPPDTGAQQCGSCSSGRFGQFCLYSNASLCSKLECGYMAECNPLTRSCDCPLTYAWDGLNPLGYYGRFCEKPMTTCDENVCDFGLVCNTTAPRFAVTCTSLSSAALMSVDNTAVPRAALIKKIGRTDGNVFVLPAVYNKLFVNVTCVPDCASGSGTNSSMVVATSLQMFSSVVINAWDGTISTLPDHTPLTLSIGNLSFSSACQCLDLSFPSFNNSAVRLSAEPTLSVRLNDGILVFNDTEPTLSGGLTWQDADSALGQFVVRVNDAVAAPTRWYTTINAVIYSCSPLNEFPLGVQDCLALNQSTASFQMTVASVVNLAVEQHSNPGAMFLRCVISNGIISIWNEASDQAVSTQLLLSIDQAPYMLFVFSCGLNDITIPIHWTPFDADGETRLRVGFTRQNLVPVAFSDIDLAALQARLGSAPMIQMPNENDALPLSLALGRGTAFKISSAEHPYAMLTACASVASCDTATRTKQRLTDALIDDTSMTAKLGISRRGYPFGTVFPNLLALVSSRPVLLHARIFAYGVQAAVFLNFSDPLGPSLLSAVNCSGEGTQNPDGSCTCTRPWLFGGARCSIDIQACRQSTCSGSGFCVENPAPSNISCVCDSPGQDPSSSCASCFSGFSPALPSIAGITLRCFNCIAGRFGRYCNYTDGVAASAADGMCNTDHGARTEINFFGQRCACSSGWFGSDCSIATGNASAVFCNGHGVAIGGHAGAPTPPGIPLVTDFVCACDAGYAGPTCTVTSCDPGFDMATHCTTCLPNFMLTISTPFPGVNTPVCEQCAQGFADPPSCITQVNSTDLRQSLCHGNGDYVNNTCVCDAGYGGSACDYNATAICLPGGVWTQDTALRPLTTAGTTVFGCRCPPGSSDAPLIVNCTVVDPLNPLTNGRYTKCSGHGVHSTNTFTQRCACDDGWVTFYSGSYSALAMGCNMNIATCGARRCSSHGSCVFLSPDAAVMSDEWGLSCLCDSGWFGAQCEFTQQTCAVTQCSAAGECQLSTGTSDVTCICDQTSNGTRCQMSNTVQGLALSVATSTPITDDFTLISDVSSTDSALRVPLGAIDGLSLTFAVSGERPVVTQASALRRAVVRALFGLPTVGSDSGPIHDAHRARVAGPMTTTANVSSAVFFSISCATGGSVNTSHTLSGWALNGSEVLCVNKTTMGISGCEDSNTSWSSFASFVDCRVLQISSNNTARRRPLTTLLVTDGDIRPWSLMRIRMAVETHRAPLINDLGRTTAIVVTRDQVIVFKAVPRLSAPPSVASANPCPAQVFPLCADSDDITYIEFRSASIGMSTSFLGSQTGALIFGLPVLSSGLRYDPESDSFISGSTSGFIGVLAPASGPSLQQSSWLPISAAQLDGASQVFRSRRDRRETRMAFVARIANESSGPVIGESFRVFRVDAAAYKQNAQASVSQPAKDQQRFAVRPIVNSLAAALNTSLALSSESKGAMVIAGDGRMMIYVGQVSGIGWVSSICASVVADVFSNDYADYCASSDGQLDDGKNNGVGSTPAAVLIDNPLLCNTSFLAVSPANDSAWTVVVVRRDAVTFFALSMQDVESAAATVLTTAGIPYGSRHLRTFNLTSPSVNCVYGEFSPSGRFFAAACGTSVRLFFIHPSGWPDALVSHPATAATAVAFDPTSERLFVSDDGVNDLIVYDSLAVAGRAVATSAVLRNATADGLSTLLDVVVDIDNMVQDNGVDVRIYGENVILPQDAALITTVLAPAVYHKGATRTSVAVPSLEPGVTYTAFVVSRPAPGAPETWSAPMSFTVPRAAALVNDSGPADGIGHPVPMQGPPQWLAIVGVTLIVCVCVAYCVVMARAKKQYQ